MRLHATKEEVAQVRARIEEFGYKVHSIEGEERVVIGAVGMGDVTNCLESLEAMPQVEKAVRISAPYKFVSKEFRPHKTEISVNGTVIGGDDFVVAAGPSLRRKRKTDSGVGRDRRQARSQTPRRCLQAPHSLRFPRHEEEV
jgi:3-deoxy-7-phosphoheptulonate synthase